MIKRSQNPALNVMIDNFDSGDPWGSTMGMAFALADVATAIGNSTVQATLMYSPGAAAPQSLDELADDDGDDAPFEAILLAAAYRAGEVDDDDLERCAHILSRYLDVLQRAGRDY